MRTIAFINSIVASMLLVPGAVTAQTRVAILAGDGERAPQPGLVELLQAAVSRHENVQVLERKELERVLREQDLSAAVNQDAPAHIRLGEILGAELLVFVERVQADDSVLLRLQSVESRTGIVLSSSLYLESAIEEQIASLQRGVAQALRKSRVNDADRIYIALGEVHSDELVDDLDPQADALAMLLTCDLNQSDSIIVLDRERLPHLLTERDVAGIEQDLKRSVVLLEGGIRRSEDGALMVTIRFNCMGGRRIEPLSVQIEGTDVQALRRTLVTALIQQLHAVPRVATAMTAVAEAEIFLARGKIREQYGERDAAIRLMETSYCLDPTQ
jgi:curli biogenesis system outer membrane secretion channel CsgG